MSDKMTREERIAANNRAIETARSQEEPGFLSAAGDALAEGAKGAARAVKDIGGGIVGMVSGAARLAGTPVRLATGWEGLHRLADTIDSSYENFGRDALMSEYGENPDGWGYALGRAGEKIAGVAGSLAALGGVGKAVGVAGTALKTAGHAKTAAAVANTLPLMFGNDAAVRAYDTARANGRSKTEAASLAALNGAIHFLLFKAFENQSLKKMLNIGPDVEMMMPKWADALAEEGGQSFSSLVRGTRNGMVKYIAAENGKRALKAGGIMGLQDMLSDPVMQVAEGADIDDIDFSRMLKAGAHGVGEGALMEGLMGGAAIFRSQKAAEKFMADKYFRGKDYKVVGPDGKPHDEPGLLNSPEGRMFLMKQNPDATERVLDIVEHGGTPRPAELDAAFLPPDMTAEELKKFASDWRNDLKPYVEEAWAADAPRQTPAPDAASAKPGRDMLSPEEAQSQQKAANDAAERQKLADRRAAADSMMLDFESWNRLYADGKTDLNFDEWRAAGKPGVIEANLTPKTEEAPTSETRANEAPAQPEQAEVVAPPAGAEARPVESAEARPEAADARVVKKRKFASVIAEEDPDNPGKTRYRIKVEGEDPQKYGYIFAESAEKAEKLADRVEADRQIRADAPKAKLFDGTEVFLVKEEKGWVARQMMNGMRADGGVYSPGKTKDAAIKNAEKYITSTAVKKSELVGVMPLTAVPTEGATPQTAENRAGAAQEGTGARPVSETATTTPAPAKPAEAPSRVSGAEPVPDGKGKMVKPATPTPEVPTSAPEAPKVVAKNGEVAGVKPPAEPVKGSAKAKESVASYTPSKELAEAKSRIEAMPTMNERQRNAKKKAQKDWLLSSIDEAIGSRVKTAAQKSGADTEGFVDNYESLLRRRDATYDRTKLTKILGDIKKAGETLRKGDMITFDVPDDGTFKVYNNPEALTLFKRRVQKRLAPTALKEGTILKAERPLAEDIEDAGIGAKVDDGSAVPSGGKGDDRLKSLAPEGDLPDLSAEPSAKPKSNRLRRRDGTDPLAEKNPAPKTVRKAVDKISLAISNRTGTGVITPEEADGIVQGIVESPETKHNRYRDFFNPLESNAKWHESLGLDAESAKNIRDAFDRVKADADLKKWFPQVDSAIKKANDGNLSKKDAAPLFGKISEGLERAERMGLSETAKRLRDAAEVIRPVAETITQGDVNKFNYSTKGQKLNNRLGGTDKRGGKTVSLDTKNGTVDVGSTGQGGSLDGNRRLIIDGVNGDELTVTMKDAAGKTLATRKMTRAQWAALANGADAVDGDPAAPQKGDLIRRAKSGAADLPDAWTPKARKPLERVAHALRNVVTVGGKKVKVEFLNERPADVDGQTRKSVGGIFTGTAADYANRSRQGGVDDGPSVKHIGTGEGSQVYGWGLYGSTKKSVAMDYATADANRKRGRRQYLVADVSFDGKPARDNEKLFDEHLGLISKLEDWGSVDTVLRDYEFYDSRGKLRESEKEDYEFLKKNLNRFELKENKPNPEHLYEQTFFTDRAPGDESHLLKWYDAISDANWDRVIAQAEKEGLREKLKDAWWLRFNGDLEHFITDNGNSGDAIYERLSKLLGGPQSASEFLARAGIDGVKYPVGTAGGKVKDGDKVGWNYVSFRDDNIRVDHKWTDGELRYMRNADGVTVGEYDAANGEIRLYPGATVADVVHEFTHPLVDYARAEAKAGRGELLGKINQIIDAERATWEQPVRDAYKDKSNETILEEIFTHAMGEKGADLFGKSTKTLQGRRWYNRLWEAIKGVWQDFATKMGWNKADLRGLDGMSPEDAAQKILSEMAKGRNFGDVRMARGLVTPDPNVRLMDDEVKWLDRQGERFVDSTHNLHRLQDEVGYRDRSKSGSVGVEEVMDPKTGFVDWHRSTDIQKAIVKSNGFVQKHEHILQIRRDKATREMAKMKGLSEDAKRELVDNYLTALHAPERNRTIADRRGDKYNDDYAEGAGRSANWARDFIDNDPNVQKYKAELDKIADIVHEAVMEDLRLRHENGLLSDDEYNFYSKQWKHYVPLRTDLTEGSPEGSAFNTSTATFNRSEYRTAKGRGADNIASSPFAFAFVQAHDGIGKSAKNIIGNVTANFIDMTEAKGLNSTKVEVVAKDGSKSMKNEYRIAEVVPAEVVRRGGTKFAATFADGSTAEIGSDMRLASHQDNLVLFKRPEPVLGKDGKPTGKTAAQLFVAKFTEGKNGRGTVIAKAITGKNMVEVPFWVQPFSKATQFLSRMNTSASPSFLTSNIFNDRNEAWRTMSARFGVLDGAKMAAKVWKYRYADSNDLKNWLKNGELRPGSDVADFINGGAAIKGGNVAQGFSGELSSLKDNLAKQERKARSWWERFNRIGRFENVREIVSSVGDVVQSANELEELGTRYGVYHAVLDELVAKGVPREVAKAEAVTFCRGATTDFNVRGTLAPIIGSFYMFYNANVQGTRRNIQSLTDKHGVQTFATLAAVASAMTVMRYWLGNDDEREKGGERNAKNALEYQKQSAMGIPIPSGRELSILKMRGVDSLIPYAATKFTEAALYDDVSTMEALGDALKVVAGEMFGVLGGNGVGNKSQISQTLAPSLADPFIQWATGTDWQGERRVKQVIDKTVPQSYNARHGTSEVFKWIAETVNDISGGNQYRRGVVDMAPEDVQLIVETLAGGLGRDITGAINTYSNVKEVAQGGSSERLFGKMPVVKSLVREYPDSTSRYYAALDDYERDKAEFKKTTPERRKEMKVDKPYLFVGKSLLDGQIERVKEYMHLERGEVKVGQKWVEPKTPRTEEQKEVWRKKRLALQAQILERLGK